MTEKICLVTGASSGIGRETVRALAEKGATVIAVSRESGSGKQVTRDLREATDNPNILFFPADLSLMREVRQLATHVKQRFDHLDVLVNNAGVIMGEYTETPEGIETTFALNHLSYFLLTNLLLPLMKSRPDARVVNVASQASRGGFINLDDPMLKDEYRMFRAYGQSKLANIMFTFDLAKRLNGSNVTANAMHPGFVATNFGSNNGSFAQFVMTLLRPFARSPKKGAETVIYLASSDEVAGESGGYYKDKAQIEPHENARDPELQRRLWELSERLTKLKASEAESVASS